MNGHDSDATRRWEELLVAQDPSLEIRTELAAMAAKAQGWRLLGSTWCGPGEEGAVYIGGSGPVMATCDDYRPDRNIAQAMELQAKLADDGWDFHLEVLANGLATASFQYDVKSYVASALSVDVPLAITRAYLITERARGEE